VDDREERTWTPEERKAIELVRGEFAIAETRLYDHVSDTFRWMMATLFAANAGAMLALFNKGSHQQPTLWALGWFSLGVIASLLMGGASSFVSVRAVTKFTRMRLKLEESLITGQTAMGDLQQFGESQKWTWKTWVPSYIGVASLLFFIIGLGTIAASFR
jgi:hypothetical protein